MRRKSGSAFFSAALFSATLFFVGELVTLKGVHSVCARKYKLCIEDSSVEGKNRAGLLFQKK